MTTPIARPTDPETSHEAAESITDSGRRQSLAAQLLRVIKAQPGLTGGEISEVSGIERWAVTKRLSDLKNNGQAIQGPARPWHGKNQVTWWPVQSQGRLPEG